MPQLGWYRNLLISNLHKLSADDKLATLGKGRIIYTFQSKIFLHGDLNVRTDTLVSVAFLMLAGSGHVVKFTDLLGGR